jgi:hypothetical protein
MNETLTCFACGRALHVPDDLRGQAVKCPACHHTFTAPEAGFDSVPPASSTPPFEDPSPRRPILYPETGIDPERPYHSEANNAAFPDAAPWRGEYAKPAKVQAIAIMTLVGGIIALLAGVGWTFTCVFALFPGAYCFVVGIMAIIKGANLLTDSSGRVSPPKAIAIMQIINIISFDVVNLALGIITLVLLGDPDVKAYFRC